MLVSICVFVHYQAYRCFWGTVFYDVLRAESFLNIKDKSKKRLRQDSTFAILFAFGPHVI